ncbi:MAG TPA: hypothetical protein PKD91_04620 [Bacteroidia bacterium]|nr:hypothetical protein [Bacteroidia bacterium]
MSPVLRKINIVILSIVLITMAGSSLVAQSTIDVEQLTDKIKSAQKVEELYSIKYNLDKYSRRTDLSIEDQRKLNRTYVMLSAAFKARSHFRNAADVYYDYLKLNESYLKNYNNFSRDSIIASHQKIKNAEASRINELDNEINQLNKTRDAVAGLKSKYYSAGTIATIGILVLFLIIFITRNRAIRLTQNKLIANREKVLSVYKQVLDAKILKGSISYSRQAALDNIELIDKLIAGLNDSDGKKRASKEIQALLKAKEIFTGLSS